MFRRCLSQMQDAQLRLGCMRSRQAACCPDCTLPVNCNWVKPRRQRVVLGSASLGSGGWER